MRYIFRRVLVVVLRRARLRAPELPQEKTNLDATNKKLVNKLGAALRQRIQCGGATPWQAPLSK